MRTIDATAYKMVMLSIEDLKGKNIKVTNSSLVKETGFTKARISKLVADLRESGHIKVERHINSPKENSISLKWKGECQLLIFKMETASVFTPDEFDKSIFDGLRKVYELFKKKEPIRQKKKEEEL